MKWIVFFIVIVSLMLLLLVNPPKVSEMPSEKCLLVFHGEVFRYGGEKTPNINNKNAIPEQIEASKTHRKLIDSLNCDVCIVTKSTDFDDSLKEMYGSKPSYFIYDTNNRCAAKFTTENIDMFKKYTHVVFLRIDAFLKDRFFEVFKLGEKIGLEFLLWISFQNREEIPNVSDTIIVFPNKYMYIINKTIFTGENPSGGHWGHGLMRDIISEWPEISEDDFEFMIDTLHDSDSQKDWNPLHRIVNRPESSDWQSTEYLRGKKHSIINK